jgi:hypothetical protein
VTVTVPAGTELKVQTIDVIDSSRNHAGDLLLASVAEPISANDKEVVPANANAHLQLVDTRKNSLQVQLVSVECQGKTVSVMSTASDVSGKPKGGDTGKKVGCGMGGILLGHKPPGCDSSATSVIEVPAATKISFRLQQPLTITYMPVKAQ